MASGKEMIDEEKGSVVDAPPPGLVQHIDDKILKHSHDADAAMRAFEGYEGQTIEISEETNRRLLRKIDWHLMPVSTLQSLVQPIVNTQVMSRYVYTISCDRSRSGNSSHNEHC